jgi:cytochrome c-type biogenesis protein
VVIGYVGGYAGGSQKKAIQYSLVFTLGLTITFTILGAVAAFMGRLFGSIGDFWKYIMPPVAIFIGVQLITEFNLNFGFSQKFMPHRKAFIGAFLIGLFFGVMSTPCATPILAVILTYAASKQSILYSIALLMAYAAGHWAVLLAVGVSAGAAQKAIANRGLTRATSYIKKGAGVLLICVGLYLIVMLIRG